VHCTASSRHDATHVKKRGQQPAAVDAVNL